MASDGMSVGSQLNLKVYVTTTHDDGSDLSTRLFTMASLTHISVAMNIVRI